MCSYWAHVDIFVYFSHAHSPSRVRPPSPQTAVVTLTSTAPSWTNACHANGVRCLGTWIVEGLAAGPDEAARLLAAPDQFTAHLLALMRHFNFDGWFFNFESAVTAAEVPQLIAFLQRVRAAGHAQQPDALFLWRARHEHHNRDILLRRYDSLVETGEVKWQNALNARNAAFFEASARPLTPLSTSSPSLFRSEGIFLNYAWSRELLASSVAVAGPRAGAFSSASTCGAAAPSAAAATMLTKSVSSSVSL